MRGNIESTPGMKVSKITFTRVVSAVDGDVSYTGVGFKPSFIHLIASSEAVQTGQTFGYLGTGVVAGRSSLANDNMWLEGFRCVTTWMTVYETVALKSFDADGFTLTYTKTGATPANTWDFIAVCIGVD